MSQSSWGRPALRWTAAIVVALLVLMVLSALLLNSRWLGLLVIHRIAAKTERTVRIDGPVRTRFWSLTPRVTAENVTIENPPWMRPGTMAHIGRITLLFSWPHLNHRFALRALQMSSATLYLHRDVTGRSNWQLSAPGTPPSQRPAIIHGLSVPAADVRLDDEDLHLQFTGRVSAGDASGLSGERPLGIIGTGRLNGRPVSFRLESEPLASARSRNPYHFRFEESSSGSHLQAQGILPRPFDFLQLDASFQAQGEDLKDLYFLTGVSLTDTGRYRLSGTLRRRGSLLSFDDLVASSAQTDLGGTVVVHSLPNGHMFLQADLSSRVLRLADLGARAAGREASSSSRTRLLISDRSLGLQRFRHSNARVRFRAGDVVFGPIDLRAATAQMAFQNGDIRIAPVSATLAGGSLSGQLHIDLTHEAPQMALDLTAHDIRLGQLSSARTTRPLLEGPLDARLTATGRGDSPHALAATAQGRMTAVLPHGSIEASIAELAGLDFARWLGVVLGTKQKEASVRCGIASLSARQGTLDVDRLMIDTGPALIVGTGEINLDTEALDLTLSDKPTHLRLLHKHVPVRVVGTLRHPKLDVGSLGNVGAKAALGAVLAPIQAIVHLIDPKVTQSHDCAAVLATAQRTDLRGPGTGTSAAGPIQRR